MTDDIIENTQENTINTQPVENTSEKHDFSNEFAELKNAIASLSEKVEAERGKKIEEQPINENENPEMATILAKVEAQQKIIEELTSKIDSNYTNKITSIEDFEMPVKKAEASYDDIIARDTAFIKHLTTNKGKFS